MSRSRLAGALGLAFLLGGCGSSQPSPFSVSEPVPHSSPVRASVQGPPTAGSLTVSDLSGQPLGNGKIYAGMGLIELPAEPESVLVTLKVNDPAKLGAGPGTATFQAEVADFDPNQVVGVDAVTSLIALYHARHPEIDHPQAAARVFTFLGLPEDTEPNHVASDSDFDNDLFFRAAAEAGGVDVLLASLVQQLETSGETTLDLTTSSNVTGYGPREIAQKLFEGALGYVGGKAFGWLVGAIGLGPSEGPDISAELDAVRNQIKELESKITFLSRLERFATKDTALSAIRPRVLNWTETLARWGNPLNQAPPSEQQIAELMNDVRRELGGTLNQIANLELNDELGGPGLTGLFQEATLTPFYVKSAYDNQLAHLRKSTSEQELVLNLLVEADHHANPPLLVEAEAQIDTLLVNLKQQRQLYPMPVADDDNVLLDPRTGLLWHRHLQYAINVELLDPFLKILSLSGAPVGAWKVANADQVRGLFTSVGLPGLDQHQNQALQKAGFLGNDGQEFGDIDGREEVNWMVYVGDNFGNNGGLSTRLIDLRNGRVTNAPLRLPGITLNESFAYLLCRPVPTVGTIEVREKSRSAFTINYQAIGKMSDGSELDMTEMAIWSTDADVFRARIANDAVTSGQLVLRQSGGTPVTVTARYRNVRASVTAPVLTFTAPTRNVLITPTGYRVETYPSTHQYSARRVLENGVVVTATSQATWSSSDPSVSVTPQGLVTYLQRPTARKAVEITATIDGKTGVSNVILEP